MNQRMDAVKCTRCCTLNYKFHLHSSARIVYLRTQARGKRKYILCFEDGLSHSGLTQPQNKGQLPSKGLAGHPPPPSWAPAPYQKVANRISPIYDVWFDIWYDIWYDIGYDIWYDIWNDIWYDMLYDMIYDMWYHPLLNRVKWYIETPLYWCCSNYFLFLLLELLP